MAGRRRRLVEQVFALSPTGNSVLVVSHWAGFSDTALVADRRALTAYVGRTDGDAQRHGPRFMPAELMEREIAEALETAGDRTLTEAQARARPRRGGVSARRPAWAGRGPATARRSCRSARYWCQNCGRPVAQAATTMAGGYRREKNIDLRVTTTRVSTE
jgi:hypothetical protein